jgi:hypothetical protein
MKLVLLTLLFLPSIGLCCSSVDLREERCPDGSPRLPAPRDQGLTNYCFAYSLTNLYSHSNCVAYSPLSTGLLTNRIFVSSGAAALIAKPGGNHNSNSLNRGFSPMQADQLIREARLGPCLESEFPSDVISLPENKSRCNFVEPWVAVEELLQSLASITQGQSAPLSCTRRPLENVDLQLSTTDTEEAIERTLDRGKVAVVHLDSKIFQQQGLLARGGDHYVSVVGRRMINGTCHYLVRDSNRIIDRAWTTDGDYDQWIPSTNVLSTVDEVIHQR